MPTPPHLLIFRNIQQRLNKKSLHIKKGITYFFGRLTKLFYMLKCSRCLFVEFLFCHGEPKLNKKSITTVYRKGVIGSAVLQVEDGWAFHLKS